MFTKLDVDVKPLIFKDIKENSNEILMENNC